MNLHSTPHRFQPSPSSSHGIWIGIRITVSFLLFRIMSKSNTRVQRRVRNDQNTGNRNCTIKPGGFRVQHRKNIWPEALQNKKNERFPSTCSSNASLSVCCSPSSTPGGSGWESGGEWLLDVYPLPICTSRWKQDDVTLPSPPATSVTRPSEE